MGIKILTDDLALGGVRTSIINRRKFLSFELFSLYNINENPKEINATYLSDDKSAGNLLKFLLFSPFFIFKFARYINDDDILITEFNRTHFIGYFISKIKKIKWISINHMPPHLYSNSRLKLVAKIQDNSDKVIFVSEHYRYDLKKLYKYTNKLVTIYNPINTDLIINRASQQQIGIQGDYIINIGRYVDFKNQKFLIDVYSKIRNRNDLKLLILGYGPLENELINLAKSRGFRVGRSPDEEADVYIFKTNNPYVYLKGAKAYIHTSVMEGFSVVLQEALSLNIPVFTSDHKYGSREALGIYDFEFRPEYPYRTELGALLPVATDVNSREGQIWVESLPKLLEEYDRVPGERYVREKFSPEVIANKWRDLINSLE